MQGMRRSDVALQQHRDERLLPPTGVRAPLAASQGMRRATCTYLCLRAALYVTTPDALPSIGAWRSPLALAIEWDARHLPACLHSYLNLDLLFARYTIGNN